MTLPRTLSLRMLSTDQAKQAAEFFQEMIREKYKLVIASQQGRVTNEEGKRVPGLGLYLQFEENSVRSEKELEDQLELARGERERIGGEVDPGTGAWRSQTGYINGLLYALGEGSEE